MDKSPPRTRTGFLRGRRTFLLEGIILVQLVLITVFCFKATSILDPWPARRVPTTTSSHMRIATYNLRYDSQPDNITVKESLASLEDPMDSPWFLGARGEQPWSTRRVKIAQHLLHEGVVMASFQEALVRQVNDLQELLGDDWGWIGVGRDDGKEQGEFSPIFYKKSVIDLIDWDTFWLSDTPFEPSIYPDAGSPRLCTLGHFTLNSSSPQVPPQPINFTLLNTHLDDRSDTQRRLGASFLLARAKYEAHATAGPVLVTGDFNSPSTGTDSGAYEVATGRIPPLTLNETFAERYAVPVEEGEEETVRGFVMRDVRTAAPRGAVSGDFATYTGFSRPGDPSSYTRIDFVFGGSNGKWTADAYRVASALTDDGVLASDHRPVFVDLTLTGPRTRTRPS